MLFLPQEVYDERARLFGESEAGRIPREEALRKILELDPNDGLAMIELAHLRKQAGDLAAAEDYFWRSIQAQPCMSSAYIGLARLLNQRPESVDLSELIGKIGLAKLALEDQSFVARFDLEKLGVKGKRLKEFRKLSKPGQSRLLAALIRAPREGEPEELTQRLQPLRLLQQMQEEGDLDPETVDAIIAEGTHMVPVLIGVLRGWAQDMLADDSDDLAENALGLLGEVGSAAEISHLLEFVDLENRDIGGAAFWALGRIIERRPEESAQAIASIAAGLGTGERLTLANQILRHPSLDPEGKLLRRLSEGTELWSEEDRDVFFPLLLMSMGTAGGAEGLRRGRAVLHRHGGLLSRGARRECAEVLDAFPPEGLPVIVPEPSPIDIYEICSGNATWDDGDEDDEGNDDDEGDEDDELDGDMFDEDVPEPVRRPATPGRNDPCWCNSGKKYKKCHLDADLRGSGPSLVKESAGLPSNEFEPLRRSIGKFLGDVMPERDARIALKQLFTEPPEDLDSANLIVSDWMVHDFIAPSLGQTVMEEFLERRGSRLTQREREMVEAWTRSFYSLYEVQEVAAGTGFTGKDLILGETVFVHDVNLSNHLARWDGLLARVVPGERGPELAGIGLTVPRPHIEPLRDWMEADREETGLPWREYMKANWPRIRRQSSEIAESWRESLRITNTDGDELLFSKAVYAIVDEPAALSALRGSAEFDDASDPKDRFESFVWLNEKKTVLGNIRVEREELALDCNSKERLERGKLLLASIAGDSLRHLRDEFTTQKELKSRMDAEPRRPNPLEPEIPKEVRDQVVSEFMEQHYSSWPDTKLPALKGKTPRQAAKTREGRKQVIAILKDVENAEERKKRDGETFYEVARLRKELGLES